MMSIGELSRIDRAIEIQAPPDRVFRALTDAAELSAWFQVSIEGTIAQGSEVWMTSVHPGHVGQRFRVRFVELTPPRRLVWTVASRGNRSRRRLFARASDHRHVYLGTFRTRHPFERVGVRVRRDLARAPGEGLRRQLSGLGRSPRLATEACGSERLNAASPAPQLLFAALGDETRLALVQRLSDGGPASISRSPTSSTSRGRE